MPFEPFSSASAHIYMRLSIVHLSYWSLHEKKKTDYTFWPQFDEKSGIGQQERIDDLTLRLFDTACEATGLHHQGATSHIVCCNTYHLSHAYLHTDTKQKV